MATLLGNSVWTSMSRGYHTYQSMWVTVGRKLPCWREQVYSKDPFTVSVIKCDLIIGHILQKKLRSLLDVSTTKWVNYLLIYWIHSSMCSASSTHHHEIFRGRKFSQEEIFTSWGLIVKISASWKFPGILPHNSKYLHDRYHINVQFWNLTVPCWSASPCVYICLPSI